MRIVIGDIETFFDRKSGYTLDKMTTESYLRDPRFEMHGISIKWSANTSAQWYDEREWQHIAKNEDWSDTLFIFHHAQFDGLALSHHYDVHPKMLGCTLSMARLLLGNHLSISLDNVRKHFGMPSKRTPYHLFDGKHWSELTPAVQQELAAGCCDEVESIWTIFGLLMKQGFPREELEVVDITLKMFTEPRLVADIPLLKQIWIDEAHRKQRAMAALNVTEAELQSAEKFAELLRAEGVEISYKPSPKHPDKTIYAFAKTDQFMKDLLDDPDERIRTLAEARLGQKSNITQTRAETFARMARRGLMCVYLSYSGTGTLRPSGGDSTNWLNLQRRAPIRRSLQAPEGYLLAPIDSSQIECRVLHFLAGGIDEPVIQKFIVNEDPYVDLATRFYNEPIYKPGKDDSRKEEMEAKRGMGKQGRLMCCAADTKVLTQRGWIGIIDVVLSDQIWDGVEWVEHQGLVYQGERTVGNYSGVRMTSDHRVLCGQQLWLPAAYLQNENILSRALAAGSASLPLQATKSVPKGDFSNWLSNARAVHQSIRSILQTLTRNAALDVEYAQQRPQAFGSKNTTAMPTFARMNQLVVDYSIGSRSFTRAAKQILKTSGTAEGEFKFARNGVEKKDAENFLRIWSRSQATIIRNWKSIVETITRAIDPATSSLRREASKCATVEVSNNLKPRLPVYDISSCGPRNRFTILSDCGPLIVHNCGYGAAGPKFKIIAKNGLYGPPVDIPLEEATRFVKLYRQDNPSICGKNTGYWAQASRMLARLAGGEPCDWGPLHIENHRIYVPNGAPMIYDTLEYYKPPADEQHKYKPWEWEGFWRVKTRQGWKTMHGPKLTQNICEAVSRLIVSQAAIRIARAGYRILNWPYDELLCLIPRDNHEDRHVEFLLGEMRKEPVWLPGIPLDAEVTVGERYSK